MDTEIVTQQEVLDFQRLCKEVKGVTLSFEEAREQAVKLVQTFDLIANGLLTQKKGLN